MKDEDKHPVILPVPVLSGPGEPNYKNFIVFTPVMKCTGVRFMMGFTKPYTPVPPPPPQPGGGSSNVIPFKRKQQIEVSNSNVIPLRKVA